MLQDCVEPAMHLKRNGGGGTHSQQSPELSVQPFDVVSATSGPWLSWNGLAAKEADRLTQKLVQVFVASRWGWYERVIESHAHPVLRMRRSFSVLVDIDARIAHNPLDEREGATVNATDELRPG